jgi:hypothetical protein
MDLWNNKQGRQIALDYPDATDLEIEQRVAQAVNSGEMLVLGVDGKLHWSNEVNWGDSHGVAAVAVPDTGREFHEFVAWVRVPGSGAW